jgi:hypothetical protein
MASSPGHVAAADPADPGAGVSNPRPPAADAEDNYVEGAALAAEADAGVLLAAAAGASGAGEEASSVAANSGGVKPAQPPRPKAKRVKLPSRTPASQLPPPTSQASAVDWAGDGAALTGPGPVLGSVPSDVPVAGGEGVGATEADAKNVYRESSKDGGMSQRAYFRMRTAGQPAGGVGGLGVVGGRAMGSESVPSNPSDLDPSDDPGRVRRLNERGGGSNNAPAISSSGSNFFKPNPKSDPKHHSDHADAPPALTLTSASALFLTGAGSHAGPVKDSKTALIPSSASAMLTEVDEKKALADMLARLQVRSIYRSIYLSIDLSIYRSIYRSIYLSIAHDVGWR